MGKLKLTGEIVLLHSEGETRAFQTLSVQEFHEAYDQYEKEYYSGEYVDSFGNLWLKQKRYNNIREIPTYSRNS